jgi:hypothetical protein
MTLARLFILSALAVSCASSETGQNTASAAATVIDTARPWRKPGDKIDSILPMPEYLRRFRQGLTEATHLTGGASSPNELARRFLEALSARDTSAFSPLVISREEFAWLVFPHHLYHNPPYELDPEIFWMQLKAGSAKGLGRALQRYGGAKLALLGLECRRDTLQVVSGPLKVWSRCRMRYQAGDSVETHTLFGSIVERDGRMKLLSFANEF